MNIRIGTVGGAVAALALGAGAGAAGVMQFTNQTRTVYATAGEGGAPIDVRTSIAPGFGGWAGSASANYGYLDQSVSPPRYTARGTGSSGQDMVLLGDRVFARRFAAGASGFGLSPGGGEILNGSARTVADIGFTLGEACAFRIDGSFTELREGPGIGEWFFHVLLEGDGGTAIDLLFQSSELDTGRAFADAGVLGAGSWRLTVTADAVAGSLPGFTDTDVTRASVNAEFTLRVPAPGAAGVLGVLAVRRRRRAAPGELRTRGS